MVSAETLVLANVRWYKASMLLAQIVNQTAHSVTQTGIGLGAAISLDDYNTQLRKLKLPIGFALFTPLIVGIAGSL